MSEVIEMYKFLLIEDSVSDARAFQDTVNRLNMEADEERYQLDIAETYDSGMNKVSAQLNGIIVDIKLDGEHNGNDIVHEIFEKFRVPVAIFTGTPDTEQTDESPIKVYKKGEASHEEILNDLSAVSDTGLFNILGGTGIIEKIMTQIFWKNLYPQINLWKRKKEQGTETEKVLLRYVISHIQELIDDEIPAYVTEEMYISPPINEDIKTGSIIKSKNDGSYCIVLSPPCDLAIHKGKMKTDSILICEIEPQEKVNSVIVDEVKKEAKKVQKIASALNNNYTPYYHWLPQNTLFAGGYINFRKVITYSQTELLEKFQCSVLKVQESFVKSILCRFSTYYARQGQPDFNFDEEAAIIVKQIS